jgi:multiple sugar transport system substrate-binding protein
MSYKTVSAALLSLLAIAAMGFAGGQSEGSGSAGAESEGPVEIIFYLWEDPTYIDVVNAFNESQDEVFVNAQVIPSADYETRLTTLLAGGAEMDAFMQKRQVDMFGHHAAGHIEPLDSMIEEYGYDLDAVSAYADAITVDGQTLAIPFRGATYYTYFNKAMFDEVGEPYPSEYVDRGEWTWDQFMATARALTTEDRYGAQIHTWGLLQAIPAIQNQVDFIEHDGTIDADETVLQSFRMRKELEEAGALYPLVDLLSTRTHYSTVFFDNQAAMLLIGEWFPGMMLDAERDDRLGFEWEEWGITRLPSDAPPEEYRSMGAPTFNHVHARSDKKDAAFKFISWMGSAEGAEVVARYGFLPPLMTDAVGNELRAAIPDDESFEYFTEGPAVYPAYYTKYGSRIDVMLPDLMQEYINEGYSDDEFMEILMARLEEIRDTTN